MTLSSRGLFLAAVYFVSFVASARAQQLSCYNGICLGSSTDGICKHSIETTTTSAPDSHDLTQNPLVCAEVKFDCSDNLPQSWKDECTASEISSGISKKGYRGMYQQDCTALDDDASITSATCCTEADCNTPSGSPDALDPRTLYCWQGFCRDDETDAECLEQLELGLFVADDQHDVEANPMSCFSFFFVCTTRYDQGESSCTSAEAATSVVKRSFGFGYRNECLELKDNAQAYIGTQCCLGDECNNPGNGILPSPAASLLPSSALALLAAALALASTWLPGPQ